MTMTVPTVHNKNDNNEIITISVQNNDDENDIDNTNNLHTSTTPEEDDDEIILLQQFIEYIVQNNNNNNNINEMSVVDSTYNDYYFNQDQEQQQQQQQEEESLISFSSSSENEKDVHDKSSSSNDSMDSTIRIKNQQLLVKSFLLLKKKQQQQDQQQKVLHSNNNPKRRQKRYPTKQQQDFPQQQQSSLLLWSNNDQYSYHNENNKKKKLQTTTMQERYLVSLPDTTGSQSYAINSTIGSNSTSSNSTTSTYYNATESLYNNTGGSATNGSSTTSTYGSSSYTTPSSYSKQSYYTNDVRIDYSVLSVGVMTLGLIMVVELLRHKLDTAAYERPFFKTVLDGVYTELATLGIVEFFLYIMTEYYHNYDKAKKAVFGDVHFLLFYVAIINAFQSSILAIITMYHSNKMWILTENFNLYHYIELREEFTKIQSKLLLLHTKRSTNKKSTTILEQQEEQGPNGNDEENTHQQQQQQQNQKNNILYDIAEREFDYTRTGIISMYNTIIDTIRYPQLKYKYNTLLIQIRFHELRISFLQAYNMPIRLRISDYLIRCQLQILIKLVHVSSIAWLALTLAANVLYYILGIISYKFQDPELVGTILIWIYFSSLVLFIWIAWLTYNKMKSIFRSMMNDKNLWDISNSSTNSKQNNTSNTSDETNSNNDNNNNNNTTEKERLKKLQLAMFWGNEPSIVIAVIQFMQFGYALFCSALIIFWNEINDASIPMYLYVLSIVICYCIFLLLIGLVIPRYTMCTSLAQLVNIPLLRETLASFHLEEAKRKHYELQQYTNDQIAFANATANATINDENKNDEDSTAGSQVMNGRNNRNNDDNNDSDKSSSPTPPPPPSFTLTLYENETLLLPTSKTTTTSTDSIPISFVPNYVARRNQRQKNDTMTITSTNNTLLSGTESTTPRASETFTTTTTNDLKDLERIFPTNNNNNSSSALDGRKRNRRKNMKSISDGVSLMAKMNSTTTMMNFHDDTGLVVNSTITNRTLYASGTSSNDCDLSSQHSSSAASSTKKSLSKSNHYHSIANNNNNTNNHSTRPVTVTRNKFAVESADVMAQLVGKSTSELRNVLSELEKQRRDTVVLPTSNKALRTRRIKSKSDGVSEMTVSDNMNEDQLTYSITHFNNNNNNDRSSSIFDNDSSMMSMPNSVLSSSDVLMTTTDKLIPSNRPRVTSRRRDRRSVSDGVALMAKISSAETNNNNINHNNTVKKSFSLSAAQMTKACATVNPLTDTTTLSTTIVEESIESKTTPDLTSGDYTLYTINADSNKIITDNYDDNMTEDNSDGYWSDAEDIPEFNWTSDDQVEQNKKHFTISTISIKQQLRDYFGGKKYIVVSNLFGTTPAFFLIAKRVESFLHSQGIVEEKFVSFHFRLDATFWMLFCWLSFFWIGSVVTFIVMSPLHKLKTTNEKKVAVAAVIDYIISFVCIIVFSFAEMRRCCRDADTSLDYNNINRYLGTTTDTTTYPDNDTIDIGNVCSCLPYGSRTYGGLGTLEPYVSLIALRLARHYIAKRIVIYFGKGKKGAAPEILTNDDIADPFDVFNEDHGKGGGHGHGQDHNKSEDTVGTAAQLWEAAIVRYPEISQQYGEFSGELLRAMLGMPLVISIPNVDEPNHKSQSNVVDDSNVKPFSTRVGQHHLRLSSKLPLERLFSFTSDNDQENGMDGVPRVLNYEQENEFSYPNACLIRNMRRCDRKLLPLLEKWTVVDVVMTRYEIVYFDVASVADESLYDDNIRRSLVDSKGGKQLRLCDVAIGRTVVGILPISEIQSLYVDRYLPGAAEYRKEHIPDIEVASTEFWQVRSNNNSNIITTRSETRSMEWNTIKQDILQIRIGHNRSVLLRFYSDFEEAIRHPERLTDEDEMFGTIFKNNSFLWAQTIGRICGREQLSKQNLPHYGKDNVDEIRDYIVVHNPPQLLSSSTSSSQQNHNHHTHTESLQQHRRLQSFRMKSHRRIQSVGEELFKLEGGTSGQFALHPTTTPLHGGLMSTIEEGGGGSTTNLTKPKLMRASTMAAFTGTSTAKLNSNNNNTTSSASAVGVVRPSLTRPTLRRVVSSSDDGVQRLSSSLPSQQQQQLKKKSSHNTMSLTTTTILEGDENEQKSTRHLITDDSTTGSPIITSSSSPRARPKPISSRSRSFGFTK